MTMALGGRGRGGHVDNAARYMCAKTRNNELSSECHADRHTSNKYNSACAYGGGGASTKSMRRASAEVLAVAARPRPAADAAEFAANALAPPLSDSASATALSRSTYTCSFSLYEVNSCRVVYRNEAEANGFSRYANS